MTVIHPIKFRWTGEAMIPLVKSVAERQYEVGETYRLEPWEERSPASHRHFFAALRSAWDNLPEHWAERFSTPEHLRKYALIKTGYHDVRTIAARSNAQAADIAAFVKPLDDCAVVVVREATVTVYTAKSQSARAMGKGEFQQSKRDVLEWLATIVGVTTQQLHDNAGQAA